MSYNYLLSDLNGNPWALQSKVKVGSVLMADAGFECIDADKELVVFHGKYGLCVSCSEGDHGIIGQLEEADGIKFYIGFYLVKE